MRRREFITLLGGAAAWPLAARAQQGERMRRIGVLMTYAENDPEGQACVAAFSEGLQKLGWTDGRNMRIDYRWATADVQTIAAIRERNWSRCSPTSFCRPARRPRRRCCNRRAPSRSFSRSLSIRSAAASSTSLARPGGNVTGFIDLRIRHGRQMAGAAQGDCAARHPGGGPFESRRRRLSRNFVRAIQSRRCVARGGGDRGTVARHGEIEAPVARLRARAEWRPDRDGGRASRSSIATEIVIAGGAAPAARRLSYRSSSTAGGLCPMGPTRRPLPARGGLRRSHPQGREAGRPCRSRRRPSSSW